MTKKKSFFLHKIILPKANNKITLHLIMPTQIKMIIMKIINFLKKTLRNLIKLNNILIPNTNPILNKDLITQIKISHPKNKKINSN
jgi:uncharacterized Fe-S radical SAM superfamily protein PflX